MNTPSPSAEALLNEIASLKLRLEEAEGTLEALQSGAVDALFIGGRVYTLEGAERPYHELVDKMNEGAAFLNEDGVIVYANRYLADLLDSALPNLTNTPWTSHIAEVDQARVADWLAKPTRTESHLEIELVTQANEPRPVLLAMGSLNLAGQSGCAVIVTDLRARKTIETKIERLNRLYAMVSAVNATIARQPERTDLFQEFCRIAVDLGGYRLAWVGVPEPDSGAVIIVAGAGVTGYLVGLELSNRDEPAGQGPVGLALREGRCAVINNLQQAESTRAWHDKARAFGLGAVASVPFTEQGALCGAFTLYGPDIGYFDEEDLALLQQLGTDLSFALDQAAQAERLREAERQVLIAAEREKAEEARREQAMMLAESQRIAQIGSWQYDLHDPAIWSAETYQIFGVNSTVFIPNNANLIGLVHPEDRPVMEAWLCACATGKKPGETVFRRILPDGTLRYLACQGELLHDAEGKPWRMTGTVQDITLRRRIELRALADEERLRMALDAAQMGIFEWNLANDEIELSSRTATLFGYPADSGHVPFDHFVNRLHPQDRDRVKETIARSRNEHTPYACDYRIVWPDGQVFWIGAHGEFDFDRDGQATRMRGAIIDITQRKVEEAALREAEAHQEAARYARSLIETSLDPLVTISADGLITDVNVATEEATGLAREDLMGTEFANYFTDPVAAQTGYKTAFDKGTVRDFALSLRHRDGRVIPVLYNAALYRDTNGRVQGLFAAARDITVQQQAETALREKNELFAMFMAHSPIYTYIKEVTPTESRVLQASENFQQMIGITGSRMIGKSMRELFPAELAAKMTADDWNVVSNQEVLSLSEEFDGRSYSTIKFPIRHHDRTLLAGYSIDITAQQQAESALRASESRFRTLANAAPALIWIAGIDKKCTWFNDRWLAFTGRTLEQEQGGGWTKNIHPDDAEHYQAVYAQHFDAHLPFETEYRLRRQDGEYRWLLARGVPLMDDVGCFSGYIGACTDISISKLLTLELERTTQDLAEKTARLEENDRRKDEFLATLSHELRNPLASLTIAVQMLHGDQHTSAELAWCQEVMQRQTNHLTRLVDDLLDVSRIAHGKINLNRKHVDLALLAEEAIQNCQGIMEASHHNLAFHMNEAAPLETEGDPVRLVQVMTNLLNNAAKFTPPGGHISLTLSREQDALVITVSDDGIGIAPEAQDRIFDLFAQFGRAEGSFTGGLGIGLNLCRQLVLLHGGTITAASPGHGQGSEFVVRLPPADIPANATAPKNIPSVTSRPARRVLIVDDNDDINTSLAILLRAQGHEVRTAQSGYEGLRVAETFRPQLIIMDIGMPGLDGNDTCRLLRQQAWASQLPIVAMSGWDQPEEQRKVMAAGFTQFVKKPMGSEVLDQLLDLTSLSDDSQCPLE